MRKSSALLLRRLTLPWCEGRTRSPAIESVIPSGQKCQIERNSKKHLYCKVICKVTLYFTPYPVFQWYPQSKQILLNVRMKCWHSAFNAQGSRVIIVVVHIGAMKIYVARCRRSWKRNHKMKLTLPPKLVEKTSLGPSYFLL